MNIAFFGSSNYCLPILSSLKPYLKLVVTRPDKPVGRKQTMTPSPVSLFAKDNDIEVITPETLKTGTKDRELVINKINEAKIDLAFVADYGLIIPEGIFTLPKFGTFNIHFSKLPDLRGPSPIQFTLLRGEKTAWTTIFKLENPKELEIKMDSGPILSQNSYQVLENDTTESLYTRLFEQEALKLPEIVEKLANGNAILTPQDHSKASYCRFITKQDGFIPFETLEMAQEGLAIPTDKLPQIQQEISKTLTSTSTSSLIYSFYQAMTPWPTMWTYKVINNEQKRMIVRDCHLENNKLVLDEVQFEGEKKRSI